MESKMDFYRKKQLAWAEFVDAWRIVPRLVVLLYGWGLWEVIKWYMSLEYYVVKDCKVELLKSVCIVESPTTQQAVLITAMIGAAAVVFGFYASTGRKWEEKEFKMWDTINVEERYMSPKKKA